MTTTQRVLWRLIFTGLALATLFVALAWATVACAPVDNPPDPNTVSDCAELDDPPPGCEP